MSAVDAARNIEIVSQMKGKAIPGGVHEGRFTSRGVAAPSCSSRLGRLAEADRLVSERGGSLVHRLREAHRACSEPRNNGERLAVETGGYLYAPTIVRNATEGSVFLPVYAELNASVPESMHADAASSYANFRFYSEPMLT